MQSRCMPYGHCPCSQSGELSAAIGKWLETRLRALWPQRYWPPSLIPRCPQGGHGARPLCTRSPASPFLVPLPGFAADSISK
jgi:hypothetical protein